jgi:hypothetical protein
MFSVSFMMFSVSLFFLPVSLRYSFPPFYYCPFSRQFNLFFLHISIFCYFFVFSVLPLLLSSISSPFLLLHCPHLQIFAFRCKLKCKHFSVDSYLHSERSEPLPIKSKKSTFRFRDACCSGAESIGTFFALKKCGKTVLAKRVCIVWLRLLT